MGIREDIKLGLVKELRTKLPWYLVPVLSDAAQFHKLIDTVERIGNTSDTKIQDLWAQYYRLEFKLIIGDRIL